MLFAGFVLGFLTSFIVVMNTPYWDDPMKRERVDRWYKIEQWVGPNPIDWMQCLFMGKQSRFLSQSSAERALGSPQFDPKGVYRVVRVTEEIVYEDIGLRRE